MPETNTTAVAAALAGTGMIRVIACTRQRSPTNSASTRVSRPSRQGEIAADDQVGRRGPG